MFNNTVNNLARDGFEGSVPNNASRYQGIVPLVHRLEAADQKNIQVTGESIDSSSVRTTRSS